MMGYFGRRLMALIPVALGVATLTFALIHLVPGDPVIAMLGDTAGPADVAGLRHGLGLDRPIAAQYASFLWSLAHGDLGESISMKEPVTRLIAARFPATLELAGAGLLVAIVLAFRSALSPARIRAALPTWARWALRSLVSQCLISTSGR